MRLKRENNLKFFDKLTVKPMINLSRPPVRVEKRKSARYQTKSAVQIRCDGVEHHIEGVLIDRSNAGARLKVMADFAQVHVFELFLPNVATPEICKVIWRRYNEMGVQFISENERNDILQKQGLLCSDTKHFDDNLQFVHVIRIDPENDDYILSIPGAPALAAENFRNMNYKQFIEILEPIDFQQFYKNLYGFSKLHILSPSVAAILEFIPGIVYIKKRAAKSLEIHIPGDTSKSFYIGKNSSLHVSRKISQAYSHHDYKYLSELSWLNQD